MRLFVFFLLASVAYSAPQGGYNYQIKIDSGIKNDLTLEQYNLLQQYAQQQLSQQHTVQQQQQQQPQQQQQQQQQPQIQLFETPDLSKTSLTITQNNEQGAGGYQFANQLPQQGQNLIKFEQEQQAQPEPVIQNVKPTPIIDNVPQVPVAQQIQEEPQQQTQQISQPRYQSAPQQNLFQNENHKPVQYNKEFYYLSAPQEDFDQSRDLDNQLNSLKKNIRVLFIRAPEQNGLANAALQLAKQSMEQQTVVYVLSKQHDAADLANKLQQVRNSAHSKPDVVFIKYKTPEEAEHAQRTIQSQYEALDGPNTFNHQRISSTHNFVGSTDRHPASSIHIDPRKSSTDEEAEAPSSKYLPAATKH